MPFLIPLMIPLFVGTAAVGTTAATAGIIGTAGAVTGAGLVAGGAMGLGAYSAFASGQAAKQQGKQTKKMMEYNAAVEKRNADAARMKGKFEGMRFAEEANRARSTLIANLGDAGGLGSPVAGDLAAEQAVEYDLEEQLIYYESEIMALRHESQAGHDIMSGEFAKKRGRSGAMAGYMGAGTSLLTGLAAMSSRKKPANNYGSGNLGFDYGR